MRMLRSLRRRLAIPVACALAAVVACGPAAAQVQRSFRNASFETPALVTAGCRVYIADAQVPGYSTTHPPTQTENAGGCVVPAGFSQVAPILEIWRTPRNNGSGGAVNAPEGVQIAELNAALAARIYQNVCLINGETINWRFHHRGRGSATAPDQAEMKLGGTTTVIRVGTTNNGTFQTPVTSLGTSNPPVNLPGNTTWVRYTGTFQNPLATGATNLGFEAIGGTTSGNLLDDIQIELRPFVEFVQAASSTPEGSTQNVPTLRVNGQAFNAFTVTVNVTGGTATLGTDYTTPGNSSTMTVTIPAGTYDGVSSASLFPLPITILQDALAEQNESILLEIQPPGANPAFMIQSSAACGAAGQSTRTYTIVDDDGAVSVTKNAGAPVQVNGNPALIDVPYTIVVTNTAPAVATNYSLTDVAGLDPDVSIVSAAYTLNGGASVPLSGSGPWTLQPQWRTLPVGGSDTYVVTIRMSIARGGSTANDTCNGGGGAGLGLSNTATAQAQSPTGPHPTFTANACRNTPTPVWATLDKQVGSRASAADQFQIRALVAGIAAATGQTSGAGTTASTGTIVLDAGNLLQFDEALVAGGAPANYSSTIACSNASGSGTSLPSGPGTDIGGRRVWPEFGTRAGDDITCTIANTAAPVDLSIAKTDNVGEVVSGGQTTYVLTVRNDSAATAVTGAVVRDAPGTGIACPAANVVTCTGPGGACPTSGLTVGTLTSAGGLTLGTLAAGASLTLQFVCNVE